MSRLVVVSTCGTSIFTNATERPLQKVLQDCSNRKANELGEAAAQITAHVRQRREELMRANLPEVMRLSAELNGVVRLYGDAWHAETARRGTHLLIHSDTYLGAEAAAIVAEWLRLKGLNVNCVRVPDLNTADSDCFSSAMSWLAKWCAETLPGYRESGHRVIFNLVGGFKSLQGFMQTLGMFYGDECVYIFETGTELLRIPRLPIRFDGGAAIADNLAAFRKLVTWPDVAADECVGIPETLLLRVGDRCTLSAWGELAWNQCRMALLGQRVLEPLTDRLEITHRFRTEASKLSPERLAQVNWQLDKLARCLDTDEGHNPKSLGFKKLSRSVGDSTHEFYAWSDQDAKRILGHYGPDRRFVVDCLSRHL